MPARFDVVIRRDPPNHIYGAYVSRRPSLPGAQDGIMRGGADDVIRWIAGDLAVNFKDGDIVEFYNEDHRTIEDARGAIENARVDWER